VVIVHEWNEPWLVAALGEKRRRGARYTLLFHDTHHRAVSDPEAIRKFDLDGYDGILAFGETLSDVYRRWGWADRVFTWHEAADTRLFRPLVSSPLQGGKDGLVWIGNWGDGERSQELEEFLLRPAQKLGLPLDIFGVRYPAEALATLERHGASYRGWLPNARAPEVFAQHLATVHVPRRFYVERLPASRPSGSSRRWPAASRWSAPRGRTRRTCSGRGGTTLWRATAARWSAISRLFETTPGCAPRWSRAASKRSGRATPAHIG
jgi:spore maturation protein CgeB